MSVIGWIVMGLLAGWLARLVIGDERTGCIYTIVVGIIGALLGGALFSLVTDSDDVMDGFDIGSLAVAFVGATMFLLILKAIAGARR